MRLMTSIVVLASLSLAGAAHAAGPTKKNMPVSPNTTKAVASQAAARGATLTPAQQQDLRNRALAMPRANAKPMPRTRAEAEATTRKNRDGSISAETSVDMMSFVAATQHSDGSISIAHEGDAPMEGNDHE